MKALETVTISKVNSVYMRIDCSQAVRQELSEYFMFPIAGAQFSPRVRAGTWDGNIRLFNIRTALLYSGLKSHVLEFCAQREYDVQVDPQLDMGQEITHEQLDELIRKLGVPQRFEKRDYQRRAILACIRSGRATIVSPTGSGKSFIIYITAAYTAMKTRGKILIVVPRINLVQQLADDFVSYGCDRNEIFQITAGVDKSDINQTIVISTWNSLLDQQKEWYGQFDGLIVDECHQYDNKSKGKHSVISVVENATTIDYRYGFTGTLRDGKIHRLVVEGLFGPAKIVATSKQLMDQSALAELKVKILILKYSEQTRKQQYDNAQRIKLLRSRAKKKKLTEKIPLPTQIFRDELELLINHPQRNNFIKNLANSVDGNVLVLFRYVDLHGKPLYNLLKDSGGKPVYFVHGKVDKDVRKEIQEIVKQSDKSIIVASYGVFQMGVNIPNLDALIFASPAKSKIQNLQSIGRVLRTSEGKSGATVYDIADDLTYNGQKNYTLDGLIERIKIYNDQRFKYKMYDIAIEQKEDIK